MPMLQGYFMKSRSNFRSFFFSYNHGRMDPVPVRARSSSHRRSSRGQRPLQSLSLLAPTPSQPVSKLVNPSKIGLGFNSILILMRRNLTRTTEGSSLGS